MKVKPNTPPNVLFTTQQAAQNKPQTMTRRESAVMWLAQNTHFTTSELDDFTDKQVELILSKYRPTNTPPSALL